jgi:predicted RNase H-like HicB family nuclease
MKEILLKVERDNDSGLLVASWDDPQGGGITTQGGDLSELEANIRQAVQCHFGKGRAPKRIRLHFLTDAVLSFA